ncbi:hypothetical protein [Fodinicola feengrottensis]|uniref:Uncharacterized protein n=1 Tax=Fodinicola feengrottensis TaxID=435914 RepID=A0ABN2HGB1_9ACTN|nr:hypothetical protein [Fodinicola feengrottensis]
MKMPALLVAATAVVALSATAAPAAAAPASGNKSCTGTPSCVLSFNAPRGQMWVDYDALGGANTQISWSVGTCGGITTVNAPPQTHIYNIGNGGPVTLTVQGTGEIHNWTIGWH